MSADELASLEATLELLADAVGLERLATAERDVNAGRVTGGDEMAELMRRRRGREAGSS